MSDDELDRKCAEAMGWTDVRESPMGESDGMPPEPEGLREIIPSPTRNAADFLALLEWHAREGRFPSVHLSRRGNEWEGAIRGNFFPYCYAKERADTPLRALAMATVAWAEGREEGR